MNLQIRPSNLVESTHFANIVDTKIVLFDVQEIGPKIEKDLPRSEAGLRYVTIYEFSFMN